MSNNTYYRRQLKRLETIEENKSIYPLKFKIHGSFNQTNWLDLNKDTAIVLIEYLTKKFNIK